MRAYLQHADSPCVDEAIGVLGARNESLTLYALAQPEGVSEAGTTLGLAIAKETVARSGGSIEAESTEGKGAAFRAFHNTRSPVGA
jgi:K+-sensing histidine kinase KdpD